MSKPRCPKCGFEGKVYHYHMALSPAEFTCEVCKYKCPLKEALRESQ